VPYAAAVDGRFFRIFADVHPLKRFPRVSLITIGAAATLACLLELESLIKALIVIQTMIQFLAQCVAVILIRTRRRELNLPFRMPWFPIPALLAFCGWTYIAVTSGWQYVLAGSVLLIGGVGAYLLRARSVQEWPFT
jgi:amino acid transporter